MIYIFHGDNIEASRQALNQAVDELVNTQKLRLDAKEVDTEKVNLFLNTVDMFGGPRALILTNFFSVPKVTLDKLIKIIPSASVDVYIWQDKPLLASQLKLFPQAKISLFKADNLLYKCLNLVQPGNLKSCLPVYQKVIDKGLYDLFLYLLKGNLRRQLQGTTRFNPTLLKNTYLYLIELDYQNKSGQLVIPKEIALERLLINLLK